MATLIVSVDRTSLSLAPLVLHGHEAADTLGVVTFRKPGKVARIGYAPDSHYVEGSLALTSTLQQAILDFSVVTDRAATETAARTALAELEAAVSQHRYTITTTENDAPAQVWTCDRGSVTPAGERTLEDMESYQAVYTVTVPCLPTPGA